MNTLASEQKAKRTADFEARQKEPGYAEALAASIKRMAGEIEAKTYVGRDGKRYART